MLTGLVLLELDACELDVEPGGAFGIAGAGAGGDFGGSESAPDNRRTLLAPGGCWTDAAVVVDVEELAPLDEDEDLHTYFSLSVQKVSSQYPLNGSFPDTSKTEQSAVDP